MVDRRRRSSIAARSNLLLVSLRRIVAFFYVEVQVCFRLINGTVYVLVIDAEDANLMVDRSFQVASEDMSFFHMLGIEVRSENDDRYQPIRADKV